MSSLERKWWIAGPAAIVAVALSFPLIRAAGVSIATMGFSQFTVFLLCVLALARIVRAVAAWAVAAIAPGIFGTR